MEPRPRLERKGADGGANPAAILLGQALLSRAIALARRGRYDSAELVLTGLPRDLPEALDLLAKIRAQQGRMPEAAELWKAALRIDPGDMRFRNALRKAEQRPWSLWTRPLVAACLAIVLLVAGGLGLVRLTTRKPHVAPGSVASRIPVAPRGEKHIEVSVPGVVQTSSGGTTVLRFDAGLFSRTTLLSPVGKDALAALGRQIEPHWRQLSLTVIGHTDNLPITRRGRFQDNEALATARADTVIRYLSTLTNIPAYAWSIRRVPEVRCLFPCDSTVGRMKNRSVEISITPSPEAP
jgi:flagellar motor protein MotB